MLLVDLLLPQRCVACSAQGSALCAGCHAALARLPPPLCGRCGAPVSWPVDRCRECAGRRIAFASARAATAYDGVARALVGGWKDRGLRKLASAAADVVADVVPRPEVDAVVAVPAGRDRGLSRGHHPAGALARELAKRWELPVAASLARVRGGSPQRGLDLAARRRNVAGAFAARDPPRRIALVDDVYTTGATASAAASALRKAGARRVHVVTFARTVRVR